MNIIHHRTVITVAAAALTAFCFAAEESAATARNRSADETAPGASTVQPAAADRNLSAEHLIGKDVRDATGQKLGDLRDFVVDTESGRLLYGVVGSGGVLGVGDKLHPVPFSALACADDAKHLTLPIERTQWKQAPTFVRDELAALDTSERRRAIFDYYGQSWQALEAGVSGALHRAAALVSGDQPSARRIVFATWIAGKDVYTGDRNVGTIEDVLVNFGTQRAVVMFDPNRHLSDAKEKFVLPFSKLGIGAGERDKVTTTLTRLDFDRAEPLANPRDVTATSDIIRWTADDSALRPGSRSFTFRRDVPDVLTEEPVVARNENRGRDRLPAVTDDRTAQRNEARAAVNPNVPISKVRYALSSDKSLNGAAKHIEVLEENGRIVLRGSVANEDLKERIEDTAEKAADGWKVENQIAVTGQR